MEMWTTRMRPLAKSLAVAVVLQGPARPSRNSADLRLNFVGPLAIQSEGN